MAKISDPAFTIRGILRRMDLYPRWRRRLAKRWQISVPSIRDRARDDEVNELLYKLDKFEEQLWNTTLDARAKLKSGKSY